MCVCVHAHAYMCVCACFCVFVCICVVHIQSVTVCHFYFRNIYWTDAGARSISVAKSDGRYVKILFTGLEYPLAIAVNPRSG